MGTLIEIELEISLQFITFSFKFQGRWGRRVSRLSDDEALVAFSLLRLPTPHSSRDVHLLTCMLNPQFHQ